MSTILNIDNKILDFIQQNMRCSFLDDAMTFITSLGNAGIVWIIITIIFICMKKYRKTGITMAVALILSLLVGNIVLKPLVARIRPFDANEFTKLLISAPKDFSFPSGHTMSSITCAVVLLLDKNKIWIPAMILAVLISFSRMYLYVHYPSDVISGAIIGIVMAFCAKWIVGKMKFNNI